MQILSIKRLALSLILGFLLPLSYAILLSETFDFLQRPTPQFLVWPFGWPRPIWILLMGRQPLESDLVGGIVFMAVCNIILYGSMVYVALLIFSRLKRKPINGAPPPSPRAFATPD